MVTLFLLSFGKQPNRRPTRKPLKGAVSAQKALRGSETETRELLGGTEENSVSPDEGSLICRQINDFFIKRKQKKIEIVAKPARPLGG